jgi:cytosine/adenosine deaminase-related metal-dependent hydrolase
LPQDFDVLAAHGSAMIWSPLSNLLLYGGTARIDAAQAAGVAIGLGSDWSPSGSKNLLGS